MEALKTRVKQLYRKPGRFFSIERVFRQLEPELNKEVSILPWTAPAGRISLRNMLRNIRAARSPKADLYHMTGDAHYLVLGLPRRLTLLTIHDCVFLYQTSGYKRRLLKWLFLDWPVRHAALVTTISAATRNDILRFTGCAPEKVVVIPDPVSEHIRYEPHVFNEEEPAILFVGCTPNKNLARVIKALEGIPCRLEIIGEPPPEIIGLLGDSRINYRLQAHLTDEEIAAKYTAADLVLFPSTFEGFGLPIVEGQKAGRPVITSDLDPMREVAGGAACLVDPLSIESIREAVLRIIGDRPYREGLVQAGFENVKRFDSGRIAKQYLSCYRQLLAAD